MDVLFFYPRAPEPDRPWLQFRIRLTVTGDDPGAQAEALAGLVTGVDPRSIAELCGGSAEYARQLNYPWK